MHRLLFSNVSKPEALKSNIPGCIRGRGSNTLCNPGRWLNNILSTLFNTSGVVNLINNLTMDVTMDIGIGRLRRHSPELYLISDRDVYKE